MDLTIALQRAVRGFEHGTAALAARMGLQLTSLYHKVSPTYPTSHCSPEEMLEIMQITGDHGALQALAGNLGYVLLPAPDLAADTPCTLALAQSVQEFGEFAAESARGLADGRISDNELARIEREGAQELAAIQELMRVAARVHQASRPDAPAGLQRVA